MAGSVAGKGGKRRRKSRKRRGKWIEKRGDNRKECLWVWGVKEEGVYVVSREEMVVLCIGERGKGGCV